MFRVNMEGKKTKETKKPSAHSGTREADIIHRKKDLLQKHAKNTVFSYVCSSQYAKKTQKNREGWSFLLWAENVQMWEIVHYVVQRSSMKKRRQLCNTSQLELLHLGRFLNRDRHKCANESFLIRCNGLNVYHSISWKSKGFPLGPIITRRI